MHPKLRRALLFFLLLLAAVQIAPWIADYGTPEQVRVVRQLLDALDRDDCARALTYLAAPTRQVLAVETPEPVSRYSYCWPRTRNQFLTLRPETAQLASETSDRAAVRIDHYEPDPKSFLIPGFWATRSIVTQVTIDLVNEAGDWKVVVQ